MTDQLPTSTAAWHAYIQSASLFVDVQDRIEQAVAAGVDFAALNALQADDFAQAVRAHTLAEATVTLAETVAETAGGAADIMRAVERGDEDVAREQHGDAAVDAVLLADLREAGFDPAALHAAGANGVDLTRALTATTVVQRIAAYTGAHGLAPDIDALRERLGAGADHRGGSAIVADRVCPMTAQLTDDELRRIATSDAEPIVRRAVAVATLAERR